MDYHLARSRAAAAVTTRVRGCPVKPVLQALIRVMERLYADKKLTATLSDTASGLVFRGEQQDLHEMLGNVLDNAWKWAASRVDSSQSDADWLTVLIDDDGPGTAAGAS